MIGFCQSVLHYSKFILLIVLQFERFAIERKRHFQETLDYDI